MDEKEKRRVLPKHFCQRFISEIKITSQTHPDASPVGLRLVGLLPCAVWSPKIPKPTIAGQARVQSLPYTTNASSSSVSGALEPPINRLLTTANRLSTESTSCRCASNTQHPTLSSNEPLLHSHISTNQASSTRIAPGSTISTVAQITQPIQSSHTTAVRSITSAAATSTPNPMLLVPFAAVPGFVPIQGQLPTATATAPVGSAAVTLAGMYFRAVVSSYFFLCSLLALCREFNQLMRVKLKFN